MSVRRNEIDPDAPAWRRKYFIALALFALEVALLYLFTIRFS
jgi:hypothetical protein